MDITSLLSRRYVKDLRPLCVAVSLTHISCLFHLQLFRLYPHPHSPCFHIQFFALVTTSQQIANTAHCIPSQMTGRSCLSTVNACNVDRTTLSLFQRRVTCRENQCRSSSTSLPFAAGGFGRRADAVSWYSAPNIGASN